MVITLKDKEKLIEGNPVINYYWHRDEKVWTITTKIRTEDLADYLIALELVKDWKRNLTPPPK